MQIVLNPHAFEDWLMEKHPAIWDDWELEEEHLLEFVDEYVQREWPGVWDEWEHPDRPAPEYVMGGR